MDLQKHPSGRFHLFLFVAGGLLTCLTLAFPPSLQSADSERIGMIESTDHGVTWQFKGFADFHTSSLTPVDPSALVDNGLLVFYFFDLKSLGTDTAIVYRSVAMNSSGLDFLPPDKAFKIAGFITDPMVVKMQNGKYRMYLHGKNSIISATSENGFSFTQDSGDRTKVGGVPGALVLPDGKVRLFVCGQGITSLISDNGLDFMEEPGLRIPIPSGAAIVADPNPIRIADGTYRMAYKVSPPGQSGLPTLDEVHLAESKDGLSWTPGSDVLIKGSVPTLVELPDGRMRIYYVDFGNTSAFRQQEEVPEIKIYPNPATGVIYIESSIKEATSISIFSVTGSIVMQSCLTRVTQLSVKELSPGMYFFLIRYRDKYIRDKLVIQ